HLSAIGLKLPLRGDWETSPRGNICTPQIRLPHIGLSCNSPPQWGDLPHGLWTGLLDARLAGILPTTILPDGIYPLDLPWHLLPLDPRLRLRTLGLLSLKPWLTGLSLCLRAFKSRLSDLPLR